MSVTDGQITPPRAAHFWADGACADLPADWFHPQRGESTREAKAVCATCAVRVACLTWALDHHEKFGVWGGTSERERRRIARRIRDSQPTPELTPEWEPVWCGRPATASRPCPPPTKEPDMELVVAPTERPAQANGNRPVDPAGGRPTDVCVNCGKRYTPDRKTQRFHSKECARAWYAAHPKGDDGRRAPRIRRPRPTTRKAEPVTPVMAPPLPPGPVDVQALLGQLLAACDQWRIEADLGDIHVSVSRRTGPVRGPAGHAERVPGGS